MRFLKHVCDVNQRCHSCAGSRYKDVYAPSFDGKSFGIVKSGTIDIQDQINAHAFECDMNFIISRLNQGDTSVLNLKDPIFADFKNMPSDFRGILDVAMNAERTFNSLPIEVRKQFDNDYRKFLGLAGTEEWNTIMKPVVHEEEGAPDE